MKGRDVGTIVAALVITLVVTIWVTWMWYLLFGGPVL